LTDSQPDTATETADAVAGWAQQLGERLGATEVVVEFGTPRIYVTREAWVETIRRARDEEGLPFFSWLSAIDWARDVQVGEGAEDPDSIDERFEVICRMSSVVDAGGAHFIAPLAKDDAWIDSLVPLVAGAEWHEREAHEMFGIDFRGNPNLVPLYLPDSFEGHPLLKSFPLLSREVKPWPGTVDVEAMPGGDDDDAGPSTENPEA
jgi:NADH-quinone oxidoreductase subunit C